MCGIFGTTKKYTDLVLNEKLCRTQFRGPDFSAFKNYEKVTLGHNRLAILDLDARSNQPFDYLHISIVFNGEVYNFNALKETLLKKGYAFSTTSDTEVICAAYLAYGADCVNHFNGMFAFVLYDKQKNILFGARDRLGKKPFYYYHNGKDFEFASQPSQIAIAQNLTVDQSAVNEYFVWGYIPQPKSIWKEVKKLPPGYSLTYHLHSGQLSTTQYWDLDYKWENKFTGTFDEAKEQLSALLADAVKIRMIADVPLGVFLSGGVDSSLVAAFATKAADKVKTFSVKFNEKRFDESVYAQQVADHLGTDHHVIECNYNEGIGLIENITNYYDEPFADSSAIPSMLLAKHTRKQVTVALSGDAGDEGFLGYGRYAWMNKVMLLFKAPRIVRQSLAAVVHLSPNYRHKLIAKGVGYKSIEDLYVKMLGGLENAWVENVHAELSGYLTSIIKNEHKPLLERLADFDIKTYLDGDINTKVDRASMAFSLETRAPLMDYRVIDFARSLPTEFKFDRHGNQKRILKEVLYQHVPAAIFDRPKAGFTMPFEEWFRKDLKEYVLETLSEKELNNIPGINVSQTKALIQEHMSGKWNRYPQIWKLLVLSQWLKKNKQVVTGVCSKQV